MQQRTGRRHHQALGTPRELRERLEPRQSRVEIGDPDVAAVHYASGEPLVPGHAVAPHELQVLGSAHQIEPQRVHRQVAQSRVGVADVAEIRLQDEPRIALGFRQGTVSTLERRHLLAARVAHQERLVQLDPLGPGAGQARDHLAVDLRQRIE